MATVEEMGTRLMKAAKDLADWNFPFSESLEKYCKLLEEEQNVNLNKAALVLQNSANTYVRRVEYLFLDTTSLIQTFVDQEAARESEKNTKKDGKGKKTVIDVIDFESIDFTQYVAKNINLKNRNGNTVKLLGKRFPQLENSSRSLKLDQINSSGNDQEQENDQDATRKYSFRCNQYITSSGMLVEHLTPDDSMYDSCSRRSVISSISKENAELAAITNSESELKDRGFSTPVADTENELIETSFVSTDDSGRGSSIRTPFRPESSLSSDREANWNSLETRSCSRMSISGLGSLIEPFIDSGICTDSPVNSPLKRSVDSENFNSLETDELVTKTESITDERCRKTKKLRTLFDEVENCNSRPLEPIPFGNVADEDPKSRDEFESPSQLPLSTHNEKPQKRKKSSRQSKKSSKKSSLLNSTTRNKNKILPMNNLLFPLIQESLEGVPKSLKKCLKNLRELIALNQYEAMEDEFANLLGYTDNNSKSDIHEDKESNNVVTTTDVLDAIEDFPMPDTPESFNDTEPTTSTPMTYNDRIERLVYDIQENADVRTELEEVVMEWHKTIQVKLREVEKRPKFEMAEYTSRVIDNLRKNNGKMSFHCICKKQKRTEVSRYLLASLMLANKYNIHIDPNGDEGNMTLLLLED